MTAGNAPFRLRIPVAFNDVDAAGVVYHATLLARFHDVLEAFFLRHMPHTYPEMIMRHRRGLPLVGLQVSFKAPIRYGDAYDFEFQPVKIGRTSVTVRYRMRRASDGVLCADSLTTHVATDLTTFAAIPLPPAWREVFETMLRGAGDHGG